MGRPILTPGYYRSYTQEHNKFPPSCYRVSAPSTTCTNPAHHEVEFEEPLCEEFQRFLDNSLPCRQSSSRSCPNAPLLAASSLPVLAPTPAAISGSLKEDEEVDARDGTEEDSEEEDESQGPRIFESFLPIREYGRHPPSTSMDRVRVSEGRRNTDGGANLQHHLQHLSSVANGERNAVDWVRQRNFRLRRRLPELLRAPRSQPTPLPLPHPVQETERTEEEDDDDESIVSFESVSTPIRSRSPRTEVTSEEEEGEETEKSEEPEEMERSEWIVGEERRVLRSSSASSSFHPVILPLRRRTEEEVREAREVQGSGLGLSRMRL